MHFSSFLTRIAPQIFRSAGGTRFAGQSGRKGGIQTILLQRKNRVFLATDAPNMGILVAPARDLCIRSM